MGSKDKHFKFSVIMGVYNCEDYLDETIKALLDQTLDFEENIQLILVNDGSLDNSEEIALKYQKKFPDNIIVLSKENGGVSSARNMGLKYATGDYINFMDSDDLIFDDAFKKVSKFFSRHRSDDYDVVVIPVEFFGIWNSEHLLNFKFEETKSDFIDLNKEPNFFQCFTHSSFIKREAIKDLEFDTRLIHFEDGVFINKIILEKMKYGIVKDTSYLYRKEYASKAITSNSSSKKDYYIPRFKYGHLELLSYSKNKLGYVPDFIQNIVIYDLRWLVEIRDFKEQLEEIYDNQEIDEFYKCFDDVLSYLDIDVIRSHRIIPDHVKSFLIYLKTRDFHVVSRPKRNKVFLKSNDFILNKVHNHKVRLDIIDLKDGVLNISGSFVSICDLRFIRMEAVKIEGSNKTVFEAKYFDYETTFRSTKELCSIPWKFYYNFDFKIPIREDEVSRISFNIIHEENGIKTSMKGKVRFRPYANITDESMYTIQDNKIISSRGDLLFIDNYSASKMLKLESRSLSNIIKDHSGYFIRAIFYRLLYLALFAFMKNKKIWIMMDRPDQCGDNGEHFFQYVSDKDDGIDKYFTIEKDCVDYKRLKKQHGNRILKYGSINHKIHYLFADKIVSSHPDDLYLNPFIKLNQKFYAGLKTSDVYFLQHGVPKYDMSHWLRKYDHNLSLINSVSEIDYNSYFDYEYNYDEEVVEILGFPRFDYLTNENMKRQIVILFSWRSFIKNEHILLKSQYYDRLNSLINNERLISAAKEHGYDVVFKLHPRIVEYIEFFDKNDYVKFDVDSTYHEIICDSELMITDYSSVVFDFAYLKKPVIYYQYGDDFHFDVETSFFDEEKYGFGEIIDDEDELINKIIYYLENECKMEDKFYNHVESFYKYNDKNNSKRCYEWIKTH